MLQSSLECVIFYLHNNKKGVGTMSASAQNIAYVFGEQRQDAKVNVISKDNIKAIEDKYGKYLEKEKHEPKT